jgi:hypothetical protein
MLSRHRKTREWQKSLPNGDDLETDLKKLKGATPASVHPSRNQPLNLSHKVTGATLGTISKIWPAVKWESTLG